MVKQRPLKLSPQLVPKPLWHISAANKLNRKAWQEIRQDAIHRAGGCCEACGGPPAPHLNCHEVWGYDDQTGTATLTGMQVHCPACDTVTHMGRAKAHGFFDVAMERLRSVNGLSEAEAKQVFKEAIGTWKVRNEKSWKVVVGADLLAQYPQLSILDDRSPTPDR